MKTPYVAAILAFVVLGFGMLLDATASGKGNPYGEPKEEVKRSFKVHFDQTKFPDLPKFAWAKELRVYRGSGQEARWGQVYVILEDGRKITTTYSNIAVEE